MKILHVIPDLSRETGGPVTAVFGLAQAQSTMGHKVSIASSDYRSASIPNVDGVEIRLFPCRYDPWRWAPALGRYLQRELEAFDIVMIESLWQYSTFVAARACHIANRPYVVSPNGMLDAWSLSQKAWKKKPYMALVERDTLLQARAIHLTSEGELSHSHLKQWHVPKIVIPLGLSKSKYGDCQETRFFDNYPELLGRAIVLFLGRIHYKKQPDIAIRAFHQACRQLENAHLVVVGEGQPSYVNGLRELVKTLGLQDRVTFTGLLKGDAVMDAYRAADVFVLPSWQENFGISVVEAMAAECPVVVSDQIDLADDIADAKAGFVVPPNAESTATAIATLLRDKILARQMGKNGRQMVRERFTWERCASAFNEVFEDIVFDRKHSHAWR